MPEKFGYIINRLTVFFDSDEGVSFQSSKALDAIKQGGLKGQGMGEGILKDRVPEAHTDYIIAIISEEYGSLISILIVSIFLHIAFRIIKTCVHKKDEFLKLSLCGLASLLIFQTFIHIGVNISLLPTTGMTLPFLSYGGSSLIGSAILAGVIINYTKNEIQTDENKFEKILIATGGTGGHIFPAYSLAKHFLSKQKIVEIISDTRGIKFLKDFTDIKINEIQTFTVDKKNFFKTIYSLILIFISIFKSIFFLFKNKPDLVFGMGGYSSFPVCIASRILNIPFIVYENNLHIGKANKSLIPFAKKIFVSNSELQGIKEKYNYKICKIGNIIRHEILNYRSKIEYDNKKINFLVLGGSQAAKSFAEKLPKVFEKCKIENIPIKIYQQCLADQKEVLISKYRDLGIECEIFNFTTNILKYFSKTNLKLLLGLDLLC